MLNMPKHNVSATEDLRLTNEALLKLATKQVPFWSISDGSLVEIEKWYKSKRGHLCMVTELAENGNIFVTSHFSGNTVKVYAEHVLFFIPAEEPNTEPGTILMDSDDSQRTAEIISKYNHYYTKYPSVIPDSIYKVTNVSNKDMETKEERETDAAMKKARGNRIRAAESLGITEKQIVKRLSADKKAPIKGQIRCKIQCQENNCNNERDIKIQDAFQVKKCLDCKNKKRKKNLKKFLDKQNKKANDG